MTALMQYARIAVVLLATVCSAACTGSDEDTGVPEGTLRITADRNTVKADGKDAVTFRVMYGSKEVSESESMNLVQRFDGQQTQLPVGANTFSTVTAGDYTFTARYMDGEKSVVSDNSVVVTATPAGGGTGRDYARKLLFMQFTSVGCTNCPSMSSTLELVQSERPGGIVVASFHLQYDPMYPDPMWVKINDAYQQKFKVSGLPTGFLDLRADTQVTSTKSNIDAAIDKVLAEGAATCGVAVATEYDATTRQVQVTAKVTPNVSGVYRYLIVLVEDKISYFQIGADKGDYTHNNVVRAVLSSNIYGERFNQGNALQIGVEATGNRSTTLDDAWNPDNMRVIVAALTSADDGITYTCANTNECALGSNADYQLNE